MFTCLDIFAVELSFRYKTLRHRQTHRQTNDSIMPISYCVQQYARSGVLSSISNRQRSAILINDILHRRNSRLDQHLADTSESPNYFHAASLRPTCSVYTMASFCRHYQQVPVVIVGVVGRYVYLL